tara:strand:+ start:57 stop:392 length:336 start_codon:yes stop_codon:yes gene_type:complete
MRFYKVNETGAYAFHTILEEWDDLSFTYKSNLNIKNKVYVLYDLDKTKEEYITYSKLEKYIKTKEVIAISIYGEDYEIRIAGPELYIFSFVEEKVKDLVKHLRIFSVINQN